MGPGVIVEAERALLGIYATRCVGGRGEGLERFVPPQRTTWYAYARQALVDALKALGVGRGDTVLIPGFICREVIASLAAVGAIPRFYDVDERLRGDTSLLEDAEPHSIGAVLAVNYFGFPQPLDRWRHWCRVKEAVLIEDNCHGFLSADGDIPLGQRGDLGLFNMRKTLTLPNGAALVDNRPESMTPVAKAQSFDGSAVASETRFRLKVMAKRIMELAGPASAPPFITAVRRVRGLAQHFALSNGGVDHETDIPREAIAILTPHVLGQLDIAAESTRRRTLYRHCQRLFSDVADVRPLHGELPDGVVPQGFPFLFMGSDQRQFLIEWWQRGIQVVQWPDLPAAVEATAPDHYRRVMLVPFAW